MSYGMGMAQCMSACLASRASPTWPKQKLGLVFKKMKKSACCSRRGQSSVLITCVGCLTTITPTPGDLLSSSDLWNLWTLGIHAYQHRQVQDLQQNYIVKVVWSVKPAESPEMDPHRTISDSVAMWGTVPLDNHLWKDRIYIFQKLIKTDPQTYI